MKLSTRLSLIIFCLLLSACAAVASPTATSTPAPTLTVNPALAIPATVSLTPGPTEEPSPTLRPPLIWAEPFTKHIELKGFEGIWSPTANELVGTENTSLRTEFRTNTDTLVLASAPAFVPIVLDDIHKNTTIGSVTWSLDGQKVFYGIYRSADFVRNTGVLWSIVPDETIPVKVTGTSGGVIGWMDAHTLVFEGYNGGGEWPIDIFDVSAKRFLADEGVTATIKKLHSRYVPMVGCRGFCNVCVLPKTVNAAFASNGGKAYICQSEPGYPTDMRSFRRPKTYPDTIDTIFQDWQAGTNNMLILAQGEVSGEPASRLLLWNVDTDSVASIAPGGLYGRFSPDGKLLAYITSGPSDQYTEKNVRNIPVDITIPNEKQYLQIMNVGTGQIMLQVPLKTYKGEDYSLGSSQEFTTPGELSFSPDGHYLTFQTVGSITLKDAHFPTKAMPGDSTGVYFHILDLQEEKIIQSLPEKESALWAPTSNKFICMGNSNWDLFDLPSKTLSPITQSNGNQLIYPAWSYDGSYVSFSLDHYAAEAAGTNKTYILNLIPNP